MLLRQRLRTGNLKTSSGMRHATLDIEQSLSYIVATWKDYLVYCNRPALHGRIVEIGPGDNFGVALLFLHNGAGSVVAIDKFVPVRDADQQNRIYRALSDRFDLRACFEGEPTESTILNLTYLPGVSAEQYFSQASEGFDAAISRAVLEHLDDPLGTLTDMWRSLRPRGLLVHRVDLRDHGMFKSMHPLTYLTVPDRIYRIMAEQVGRPNRILLPAYRDYARHQGWPARFGITRLVGVSEEFPGLSWQELPQAARQQALRTVSKIRPKLASRFSALADEDLSVSGFVIVVEKPVPPSNDCLDERQF